MVEKSTSGGARTTVTAIETRSDRTGGRYQDRITSQASGRKAARRETLDLVGEFDRVRIRTGVGLRASCLSLLIVLCGTAGSAMAQELVAADLQSGLLRLKVDRGLENVRHFVLKDPPRLVLDLYGIRGDVGGPAPGHPTRFRRGRARGPPSGQAPGRGRFRADASTVPAAPLETRGGGRTDIGTIERGHDSGPSFREGRTGSPGDPSAGRGKPGERETPRDGESTASHARPCRHPGRVRVFERGSGPAPDQGAAKDPEPGADPRDRRFGAPARGFPDPSYRFRGGDRHAAGRRAPGPCRPETRGAERHARSGCSPDLIGPGPRRRRLPHRAGGDGSRSQPRIRSGKPFEGC